MFSSSVDKKKLLSPYGSRVWSLYHYLLEIEKMEDVTDLFSSILHFFHAACLNFQTSLINTIDKTCLPADAPPYQSPQQAAKIVYLTTTTTTPANWIVIWIERKNV